MCVGVCFLYVLCELVGKKVIQIPGVEDNDVSKHPKAENGGGQNPLELNLH